MIGQGRPRSSRARITVLLRALILVAWPVSIAVADDAALMRVRVVWGGGEATQRHGHIATSAGELANPQPLGIEADEAASLWIEGGALKVVERGPRNFNGVDLDVLGALDDRLTVDLSTDDQSAAPIEVSLGDLLTEPFSQDLGGGNRLVVKRCPGDDLQVELPRDSLVFETGESFSATIRPRLLSAEPGAKLKWRLQLREAGTNRVAWTNEVETTAPAAGEEAPSVPVDLTLPAVEGVYDLDIEVAARRNPLTLSLKQAVARRKVQLVALAPGSPNLPDAKPVPNLVVEIDPSKPNWWDRLALRAPFGNGSAHTWQHTLGPLRQLGAADERNPGWEATPLSIEKIGQPHAVEIEYPSDVPQSVAVSIIEPNAAGEISSVGFDSGFYVPDEAATGKVAMRVHRLLFWPRTKNPLLLITNCRPKSQAVFGKIRVLSFPGRLPRALSADGQSGDRLFAAYYDRPLFTKNFSAPEFYDAGSGRSLDDWNTFYLGTARLVEYLHHVGYNGLMLSALADGATLYPSQKIAGTPRYDNGTFSTSGQDPTRKDALELVFRLFDREGLQLIPAVSFSSPLAELEELKRAAEDNAVGIDWIDREGRPWTSRRAGERGNAAYYNPLDPRVQEAMLGVVDELLTRYSRHESFAGLALQLSAHGYAQLPGLGCGFDDQTIARFERETGVRIVANGQRRHMTRASELLGRHRKTWLEWRAGQLTGFYRRLAERVRVARNDAQLFLSGVELFETSDLQDALRPTLPPRPTYEALLETGVDPHALARDPAIVLLRPQRLSPPSALARRLIDVKVNESPEIDAALRDLPIPGSVFFHEPQRLALPSFDTKASFRNSRLALIAQASPSAERNRQRFVHSMATLDSSCMFDGGWLLPFGQEAAIADLVAAYRRLPIGDYTKLNSDTQPVTIRCLQQGEQTYIYLVNDSPWTIKVALDLAGVGGIRLRDLSGKRWMRPFEARGAVATWMATLEPYDLFALESPTAGLKITGAKVELPGSVVTELENRIQDYQARAIALQTQPPLEAISNVGFEAPGKAGGVPGWDNGSPQQLALTIDREAKHGEQQSLKLTGGGAGGFIVSLPFAPPSTGRLGVALWLRAGNQAAAPRVRLALEGTAGGEPYFRRAELAPLTAGDDWQQRGADFVDLPLDSSSQLKLRVELVGVGELWIDDVELHPLHFSANERVELSKLGTSAQLKLRDGQISDCLRLLEGYWPQFLITHVPLTEAPLAQRAPDRQAALPQRPAEVPAKPGIRSRIREWMPSFLR